MYPKTKSAKPIERLKYFLHILQGQRSNVQVLIFVFNFLREAEFFIEFGRRSHNFGARE